MNSKETKHETKKQARKAKPWVKGFARFGYVSKGIVYILVGLLSIMAALEMGGGKTAGTKGAFTSLANKPYGNLLLWVIAVGLIGFVMWRLIQIFNDPDQKGNNFKGIFSRFSYLVSAIMYGILAYTAITVAWHTLSSSGGSKTWITRLLSTQYGQIAIMLVGVIVIGVGIHEFYVAYSEKFVEKFKKAEMKSNELSVGKRIGKIGLSSRGVTFSIIGYFIIMAGWTANPNKPVGLNGALSKLAQKPFGEWILGLIAAGLVLYGIFQMLKARNRYMSVH
ncbi:DUF1206 domain-containing protein [Virgibacillus sp. DJP39]|uniref:DUF1206 domain-containing protein n=1 Tax=Virgibacillus sp. DJP39 TaxID=3409790 RepID=UPI003BB78301